MSTERATPKTAGLRVATRADHTAVTRILVEAFRDDPMWGPWAFPDPLTRSQYRAIVFDQLIEGALRYPWVWLAANQAAAVWIPPGGSELSPAQEQKINSVLYRSRGARAASVLEAFEMFAEARPADPHYYLTLLGTDPSFAGRGVGTSLLSANLGRVDATGSAAYLEASDGLVPLYERFGFRVRTRFALTDGPSVNGMWREPVAPEPG
jgi:GNAT superfamily N-acetyltransferase